MKIGYICSSNEPITGVGASSVHIQEMCLAWQSLGHDVFIIARNRGKGSEVSRTPLRLYEVAPQTQNQRFYHLLWRKFYSSPASPAHRVKELAVQDENRYAKGEIFSPSWSPLHVWRDLDNWWETISFENHFYREACHIIDTERPDALYQRYSRYGFSGIRLARTYQLPLVLEMNASLTFPREWFRQPSFIYPLLIRRLERKLCVQAENVLASSPYLKNYLIKTGVSPSKVAVITNGVNLEHFKYRYQEVARIKNKYQLNGKIIVGFVGFFGRVDDLDILLDSAHIVKKHRTNIHFMIVGDGHSGERLRDRVCSEGLTNKVTFTGMLPRQDIIPYFYSIDIAVSLFTSTSGSGLATKIFEYMAAGRAIIATRLQDTEYVIADRQNGLLVQPGNAREMAAAILELASDKYLRNQLGIKARKTVEEKFTWERIAKKTLTIYRDLGIKL